MYVYTQFQSFQMSTLSLTVEDLRNAVALHKEHMSVINIGDSVRCSVYGSGVVVESKGTIDVIYTIQLDTWKLANGKSPLIYMQTNNMQKLPQPYTFPYLVCLAALSLQAEMTEEDQNDLRGKGIFQVIQAFIEADVIAKRPHHSILFDELAEALLLLVVRLARRKTDKSTANLKNIVSPFS